MSKARHLKRSVSLIPFLSYQNNQLFEFYHLCLEVHCIRYELRLFMANAFPLLKLIKTSTGSGALSTIFLKSLVWPGLEPETNPSRSGCDTTNLLGFSKIIDNKFPLALRAVIIIRKILISDGIKSVYGWNQ